jgi:hypothetical protein
MGDAARRLNPGDFCIYMIFNNSIQSLDKGQLFAKMMESGAFHRMGNTPLWKHAFKLYIQSTGDKVDLGCSRCYTKVKEWLQKH